jgi:hypothetical protein
MTNWDHLQSIRFYYAFKGKPEHPELARLVREDIGKYARFEGLDLIDISYFCRQRESGLS